MEKIIKSKTFIYTVIAVQVIMVVALNWSKSKLEAFVPYSNTLISVGTSGNAANNHSVQGIDSSSDGRYVVFASAASDLVSGDTNNKQDVFLRDTTTGITTRVSVNSDGSEFLDDSINPTISLDGRYVAFDSQGPTNSAQWKVFIHDTLSSTTQQVSVNSSGVVANSSSNGSQISGDGRYIVFQSKATNLDASDTNGSIWDIYVRDVKNEITELISKNELGVVGNSGGTQPSISCDGAYITFNSSSNNLTSAYSSYNDVYVVGRIGGHSIINLTDTANNTSSTPKISCDGSSVVYNSYANNLVTGDNNGFRDIFVQNLIYDETKLISVSTAGMLGNGHASTFPVISYNGRYIAFASQASNLVSPDTNSKKDIFIRDTISETTEIVSKIDSTTESTANVSDPLAISEQGKSVLFMSNDSNYFSNDYGAYVDVIKAETGYTECSI